MDFGENNAALLRWCLGLLTVILLLQCSISSELANLHSQTFFPPTAYQHTLTAAEIAAEMSKRWPVPVQFQFANPTCGWDAHGITSAQVQFYRATGTAKNLTVSASDGAEAELHELGSSAEPRSFYVRFNAKPPSFPETWTFKLEYTAADGTRERRTFAVEHGLLESQLHTLTVRRVTP